MAAAAERPARALTPWRGSWSASAAWQEAREEKGWFQGLNPQLEDRSPARLLREGDLDLVGPEVLSAARAFTAGG